MFTIRRTVAVALIAAGLTGAGSGIASAATPDRPATAVASDVENTAALARFNTTLGTATAIGGLGGTAVGAVAGCLIGGLVTSPTIVFAPVGCLGGIALGAGIGGVVGTLVAGGPTLAVAGAQAAQVIMAPAR